MFDWLKRRAGGRAPQTHKPLPGATARAASGRATPRPAGPRFADTVPLPEVVSEGNTQADWSAWEDSMITLDSQMQGLLPSSRIYVREARPSQLDDPDPFAGVKGRRDI
jgi:hypothetical protein